MALVCAGCHGSNHRTPERSFLALDREQQRLVAHYEPVSRALTTYEIDYRALRAGRLSTANFLARSLRFRTTVVAARKRLRRDPVTGETARAKGFLLAALSARRRALAATPGSDRYRQEWNRSVVDARRALTTLQDIRDRARLIPLPEDSIS